MSSELPMPQPQSGKSELGYIMFPFGETDFRVTRANVHAVNEFLGQIATARKDEPEADVPPISLALEGVGTFYVDPNGIEEYSRGHYMAGALQTSETRILPAHLRLTRPSAVRTKIDAILHRDNRTVEAVVDTRFKLPPA